MQVSCPETDVHCRGWPSLSHDVNCDGYVTGVTLVLFPVISQLLLLSCCHVSCNSDAFCNYSSQRQIADTIQQLSVVNCNHLIFSLSRCPNKTEIWKKVKELGNSASTLQHIPIPKPCKNMLLEQDGVRHTLTGSEHQLQLCINTCCHCTGIFEHR